MGVVSEKFFGIIEDLIRGIFKIVLLPFQGLKDLKVLIFGDDSLVYSTFTSKEISEVISPGVSTMGFIVAFFMVLGVISAGVKLSANDLNPSTRTNFIELLRDWIFVALIISNIGFVYDALFTFNNFFVDSFREAAVGKDLKGEITPKLDGDNFFGWMIVMSMVLVLTIWANFYYLMRKLTLMILMILGPLFMSLWMFNGTKKVTMSWFKELFGTIMLQSVHAITFWMISKIATGLNEAGDVGLIEMSLLYLIVIPTGEAIRSLLNLGGDMHNNLSKVAAASGLAALEGVAGSIKGALQGSNSPFNHLRSNRSQKREGEKGGASGATQALSSATSRAERMINRGQIGSKLGKAVLGSAGAVGGAVLGKEGAKLGSNLGFKAGGIAGGLAGRTSSVASDMLKKGIDSTASGLKNASSHASNAIEQEKLARELGQIQTDDWARRNKAAEIAQIRAENPHLSEKEVEDKWLSKLESKDQEFTRQARKDLASGTFFSPKMARAMDLAQHTAAQQTKNWGSENKASFIANALNGGMNKTEAERAWGKELQNQYKSNLSQTKGIAKQLTGAKPLDSFIDSDTFADKLTNLQLSQAKEAFRSDFFNSNPNGTDSQFEQAWALRRPQLQSQLLSNAKDATSSIPRLTSSMQSIGNNTAKASDLSHQIAQDMTGKWAEQNKERFFTNMKQNNGKMSEVEIEQSWQNQVQGKFNQNLKEANMVASQLTNGQSLGSFIDRNAFAQKFTNQSLDNLKNQFVNQQVSSGIPIEKAERLFEQSNAGTRLEAQVYDSISKVPQMAMSKGYETKDGIAHQMASTLTNQWATPQQKQSFVNDLRNQYGDGTPSQQIVDNAWNEKVGEVYNSHLQDVQGRISDENLRGVVLPALNKVVIGSKGIANGAYQGAVNRIDNVMDSKAGQVIANTSKALFVDGQGITDSIAIAQDTASNFVPVNAAEKAYNFKNTVAYTAGVIGGLSAYNAGSQFANKINPYNKAVQDAAMEVSEIARFAQTEVVSDGKGGELTRIANGAVQLVVEKDRSFVQVKGKDNQVKRVTGYGPGDTSLQDGQVIFQDYSVEQGMLIPARVPGMNSTAYMKDSAGYKVPVNKPLTVNASDLVANRRVIMNQQLEPIHDTYNHQVLNDSFTIQDFQNYSADQKATVVVEANRSYVAMKADGGKLYRVSSFGEGNPNLAPGQVQYKEYVMENARFTDYPSQQVEILETYEYNDRGEKVPVNDFAFSSNLDPNKMLKHRPNQRLAKRRELEESRFKQGVI